MTIEEKRKALDKFCDGHVTCHDGCPLGGKVCRCGRGAYFTRGADESSYMTDDEINAAYDIAFGEHLIPIQKATENMKRPGINIGDMWLRTPTTKTKEEYFREITSKMADVYAAKNHDYGDSFARLRERYPISILIRLMDKLNRLDTLLTGETAQVKDESIDDTLLDLANYAVMELVERRMERNENK